MIDWDYYSDSFGQYSLPQTVCIGQVDNQNFGIISVQIDKVHMVVVRPQWEFYLGLFNRS